MAPPKRHLERMKGVSKECKNGKDMWRAEYTLSGKRKREYFKTEGKAKRHLKQIIDNKKKGVAELQSLPVDVQIDLLNAFRRGEKKQASQLSLGLRPPRKNMPHLNKGFLSPPP